MNGDNGPQLEECDEIVFYSGSGWAAGRAQQQTTGLVYVRSFFTLSTGEACVITVLWLHMGSSQLHGQMVSCSIQAGAGLLCPGAGPCIALVDLRLYCQILESLLLFW